MRGLLIAFEGIDRTGKTTQTTLLKKKLDSLSLPSKILKFPDRTTQFGKEIDAFLKNKSKIEDKLIHLLFSINRWELKPTIISLLNSGTNVIMDRYSYSGIAYSNAKGIPFDWCFSPEKGLPKPDLVIYLKSEDLDQIFKREDFGEEIYENVAFQKKVKAVYEGVLVQKEWVCVEACRDRGEVAREVERVVVERVLEEKRGDLRFIN